MFEGVHPELGSATSNILEASHNVFIIDTVQRASVSPECDSTSHLRTNHSEYPLNAKRKRNTSAVSGC